MKIAILLVFILSTASDACQPSPQPIDCAWLPWTYSGCVKRKGVYMQEETRSKIDALNGGEDCTPGPTKRITNKKCTEEGDIITRVINTMGASRRKKQTFSLFRSANSEDDSICAETYTYPRSGVRLIGSDCDLGKRRRKRKVRPFNGTEPSIEHRDVVFLVDESSSVGKENFQKELELVKELARKFCEQRSISLHQTRVALTTFASDHAHHIDFDDYTNEQDFRNAVDRVKYRGQSTCLVRALEGVRDEMFITAKGSRVDRKNTDGDREADGLIVLITDGCFNCFEGNLREELRRQQQLFEDKGIFLMAFMINADRECESNFKHLFDGSVCFQGVNVPSWAEFQSHIIELKRQKRCINRWNKNDPDCP